MVIQSSRFVDTDKGSSSGDPAGLHLSGGQPCDPTDVACNVLGTHTRCGLTARLVNIHPDRPLPDLRGAIAVLSAPTSNGLLQIAAAGAVGFIAALNNSNECSRRIELRPDSVIFGFSLTAQDLTIVHTCAEQGAQARVNIEIDRSALTPVFTGVLPGLREAKRSGLPLICAILVQVQMITPQALQQLWALLPPCGEADYILHRSLSGWFVGPNSLASPH